ncbi:bifunctional diaminohydroxyphosphoribosylaminopyrimidine deaminase/5-amino-6-(5-phosphoribosylamino)uracil reductase RibD [Bacillus sp. FJAT-45037]|uniref:bifunctional diaminohydroxyphosphoribosylaminopyrimidine deaminase/5-amino-6-(5-phosphoribosylamino)uracil reductase RibD n=1 Tax=Bacillus sp. FJAT-45037 TaxID=2011007 RepID=UPI000C2324B3|nr:bifunctional diaminohydroxyphosphoribosylaminopyrimidine deaminase/5-amino-6-(5-phosphoribosylamino)uracil reductase RibD [Bacillus sp. FJAT-45037]
MKDIAYMRAALDLTKLTLGQTSPNPVVGAVVVKEGVVIGVGAHLKRGDHHAEVYALEMAGQQAEGATLYVTLEPCCHENLTPPCTNLIIEKKVKRVVVGMQDPNPKVSGGGIKKLLEAGIRVDVGLLEKDIREVNKYFINIQENKLPYVTIKWASSLDGKIATATGESKWITSEGARNDVHNYRNNHDAILVGINTILSDNPRLTTRVNEGLNKHPIRVVLDNRLRMPKECYVATDRTSRTLVFVSNQVSEQLIHSYAGTNLEIIKLESDQVNTTEVLDYLGREGINSVFVEGGASIIDSFFRDGVVNEVVVYMSPRIIGGTDALSPVGGIGFSELNKAPHLEVKTIDQIGSDIKITATCTYSQE